MAAIFNYKAYIKVILNTLGIEEQARNLYYKINLQKYLINKIEERKFRRQYADKNRYILNIEGKTIEYATEDSYSKHWFFPRLDGKIHEKKATFLLIESLKSAKCFVDIGAHLGFYTCITSKIMPDGVVYSFEMDNQAYDLLIRNLEVNNCRNVETFQVAVSDTDDVVYYTKNKRTPSPGLRLSTLNEEESKYIKTLSVKSITLDVFFVNKKIKPDIIKVDVEGAEMKVLSGMKNILNTCDVKLFFEIHPKKLEIFQSSASEVVSTLLSYGFKVYEIENVRENNDGITLNPISREKSLMENTMLFSCR